MLRRDFLTLTATVTLALPAALHAADIDYTPGLVTDRLAKGDTVFVDFFASWCSTCAAQHRVIDALRAENPAYGKAITFVTVDWDTYQDDQLTRDLNIPRRSTLVVLKGDRELGRIVAGTAKGDIKAMMDLALSAATAT
jgi:thiol-disulfide isomerase/thioredoxin